MTIKTMKVSDLNETCGSLNTRMAFKAASRDLVISSRLMDPMTRFLVATSTAEKCIAARIATGASNEPRCVECSTTRMISRVPHSSRLCLSGCFGDKPSLSSNPSLSSLAMRPIPLWSPTHSQKARMSWAPGTTPQHGLSQFFGLPPAFYRTRLKVSKDILSARHKQEPQLSPTLWAPTLELVLRPIGRHHGSSEIRLPYVEIG
jgi:hypothetical protein